MNRTAVLLLACPAAPAAAAARTGGAFAARFTEFPDAIYVRTPESGEVNPSGTVGAETGPRDPPAS